MASGLQQELRKRRPFNVAEQEAALNIVRTADQIQLQFSRLFRSHGLTGPQHNVLRILRGHGGEGLPCQEIADQMITFDPDITRLVDRLLKASLVERHRAARDRRVVLVRITEPGREVLKALDEPVVDLHRRQLGHLTGAELAELSRLLVKVRSGGGSAHDQAEPGERAAGS